MIKMIIVRQDQLFEKSKTALNLKYAMLKTASESIQPNVRQWHINIQTCIDTYRSN